MLGSRRLKRCRSIDKPDDNHRERKLESVTPAIYLHSSKTSFGKIIADVDGMENEMRLSRSRRVEVALACGFVLTALVLAGSNLAPARHLRAELRNPGLGPGSSPMDCLAALSYGPVDRKTGACRAASFVGRSAEVRR